MTKYDPSREGVTTPSACRECGNDDPTLGQDFCSDCLEGFAPCCYGWVTSQKQVHEVDCPTPTWGWGE